jgi:predicted HD superfamily hydrolase involved in NAD metabolism
VIESGSPGCAFMHVMRRVRTGLGQTHRYAHSLRVARLAERLARAHGEDPDRARRAGLLHDLARLYSTDRLLNDCAERSLGIDDFERANPLVLHARLGAELARDEFGVTDESILSAIRKHTVAAASMSRLDTILFLADGLEPGRDYPERAALARLALHDLDAAMAQLLDSTFRYLAQRKLTAAPQMLAAARAFGVSPASVSGV